MKLEMLSLVMDDLLSMNKPKKEQDKYHFDLAVGNLEDMIKEHKKKTKVSKQGDYFIYKTGVKQFEVFDEENHTYVNTCTTLKKAKDSLKQGRP